MCFTPRHDLALSGMSVDEIATVVRAWTTGRGDLCLLRAPGLAGQPDGRPTHSVGGPARGARVSLTVRASRSALDPARQG